MLARIREPIRRLLASHIAPRELFWAMFVGSVVGATPFYGLHLSLCIALSWLLRLNPPATYAAANISLPPFVPLLGFACVQLGDRILRGRWLPLAVDDFRAMARGPGGVRALMLRFFVDWTVGGVLVGAAIGIALGAVVASIARRRAHAGGAAALHPARARAITEAIATASRRYRAAPRRLRYYAFFKYRMDPCYRRIAALVPESSLTVDLGTGIGMLPLVLALSGGHREVIGVDWDHAKLAAGRLAADGVTGVQLARGDARDFELPPCDVVTLVDVLHYYDVDTQRALLARAAGALRPGGAILVREGDAQERGGAWTRTLEALAVRLGWNHGEGQTKFRGAGALAADLSALGLRVTVEALAGALHPGNVLLWARRDRETAAPEAATS